MNIYKNLSIKWKLSFIFTIIIGIFLLGFFYVLKQFSSIEQDVNSLNTTSDSAIIVSQIGSEFRSKYIQVTDFIINGTYREEVFQDRDRQLVENLKSIEGNMTTDEMKTLYQQIVENNHTFNQLVNEIVQKNNQNVLPQLIELRRGNNDLLMQLVDLKREDARIAEATVANSIFSSRIGSIFAILTALIIGLISVLLFSRSIISKLNRITDTAIEISNGNLQTEDIAIDSKDEFGNLSKAVNEMKNGLQSIIANISASAEHVASASEELSASAEETSRATEEISKSIQEIAMGSDNQVESSDKATVAGNEINEGIQLISTKMTGVNKASGDTTTLSKSGFEVIEKAIDQMEEINTSTQESSDLIHQLGDKSKEIGNIISLITGVAEQTNLLALNAAIEAARAGEHGRGFAVVADEVRKLAEQTTSSSAEIKSLVDEIQAGIDKSVTSIGGVQSSVNGGLGFVKEAGNSFTQIATSVEDVSLQINEVSIALTTITERTAKMLADIHDTNQIAKEASEYSQNVAASSEQQSATMEQITTSASSLSKMAEELQLLVERFKY